MPTTVFPLDATKSFVDQAYVGHNRWHPEIPARVTVKPGDVFRIDCRDWLDGAISNNDSAEDIYHAPLHTAHMLSGPIRVETAQPGDLLIVDIVDIGPYPEDGTGTLAGQGWGYTGIFPKVNGGGFLTDYYPDAYKAIWDFRGTFATSRHIPGVGFHGITHPGLMGTAPSAALLDKWNKRELLLINTDPDRIPPLANPPLAKGAVCGTAPQDLAEKIAQEGARTVPPRENGGNQDIKNLSKGSRLFYPVFVEGAHLSVGDLHFSQGDGEITFCGAIEMGGFIDLHVDIIPHGMEIYGVQENTIFMPGITDPHYSEWLAFSGTSVTLSGEQKYLDTTLAYERACLHAIEYLKKFGYSGEQAYLLLGSAPIEGRVSGVVDVPNACATVYLPTAIFDFPLKPSKTPPMKIANLVPAPHFAG